MSQLKQLDSSVQFSLSVLSDSLQPPWTAAHQASLSITEKEKTGYDECPNCILNKKCPISLAVLGLSLIIPTVMFSQRSSLTPLAFRVSCWTY